MTKKIKNILSIVVLIVQIILFASAQYLQYLSTKKAGVNHHLIFMKNKYMRMYLTDLNIKIILVISFIIIMYYIYKLIKNNKVTINLKLNNIIILIWNIILVFYLLNDSLKKNLLAYPYIIFALLLVILISFLIEIIFKLIKPLQNN